MDGLLQGLKADDGDSNIKIQEPIKQEKQEKKDENYDDTKFKTMNDRLNQLSTKQKRDSQQLQSLIRNQGAMGQKIESIKSLPQNGKRDPIQRKLVNIASKQKQQSEIRQDIVNFVKNTQQLRISEHLIQLDRYIQTDVLSQQKILLQMEKISFQIFAFVSEKFKRIYPNYKQILFRSVRMRCGDIYQDDRLKDQAQQIMMNWIPWGSYFFDLRIMANLWKQQKTKISKNKVYTNQFHKITVQLQKGNIISVKLDGTQITPESFQIQHLKKMAYSRLQQYARTIYSKFYRTKILIQT